MARLYAWWSESGGPGKTTNCMNSSAAISRDGHDVVVLDLDPQRGSITHYAGYDNLTHGEVETTVMDVFFDDVDPREIIVPTTHFDLVPGHESLTNFESELNNDGRRGVSQFTVVRDVVEDLAEDYDYVIIDCPATLTDLTDNAIFAARNIMVPLELTPKGEASQDGLEDTVGAMHDGFADLGVEISIAGCIPSRVDQAKIFEEYRERFEEKDVPVSPFSIPEHSLLKYSWDEQMDLFAFMESDKTRDLRPYEEHVPMAFKVIGRMMTGEYSYDDAIDRWDTVKDTEMGDADPEAVLNDLDETRANA
ncbi:chromosome partitioning protein [Natrarchaeobius halalkaliphilus]|uniref:Chromosome partitioning protein n=1 Tax=Natrarchaeobius halalkaliphilus TaxID=1679091 RepID=A0A3N6LY80_9EURY|nr:ParA family protein [Natrarchaeobius halalkaliphilus]RQG86662.1 chromosome partitioning protein [Natrarchaeobius halalkaliphilus]